MKVIFDDFFCTEIQKSVVGKRKRRRKRVKRVMLEFKLTIERLIHDDW